MQSQCSVEDRAYMFCEDMRYSAFVQLMITTKHAISSNVVKIYFRDNENHDTNV